MEQREPDDNTRQVMGEGLFWLLTPLLIPVWIVVKIGGKLVRWLMREDERG